MTSPPARVLKARQVAGAIEELTLRHDPSSIRTFTMPE
jgi:hypothetical protein